MLRLLVVEDDATLRTLLAATCPDVIRLDMHPSGATVHTDPRAECPWDGAMVDWMLPGEDGMTIAHRLRNAWPDLPIVVWSAAPAAISRRALEEGFQFIAKPDSLPQAVRAFGWET